MEHVCSAESGLVCVVVL